jgi:hypothetical protein
MGFGLASCILAGWQPIGVRGLRPSAASGSVPQSVTKALPSAEVASLIVWIATAPPELVLNEAIISPLEEEGWP